MIKKIMNTLSQIFFSPEAEGSWSRPYLGEDTTNYEEWIEQDMEEAYVGVPAPKYLENDPWFGDPILSDKQEEYKTAHEEAVADNQILAEGDDGVVESPDIHQKMYEIATQGGQTTVQRDPIGGSENFHSGPGGWMSGTGQAQFRRA